MKLKTNIFFWIFPAIAVPMVGLILATMAYNEKMFRKEIDRQIFSSLSAVATGLNRRFLIERDLVRGLSELTAVQDYISLLHLLQDGNLHPGYYEKTERLTRILEIFQSVRTSLNTIRVLDASGNTLIKVRSGQRVPVMLEMLGTLPYVEEAADDAVFLRDLKRLKSGSIGAIMLPKHYYGMQWEDRDIPVMTSIIPLEYRGRTVGYFTVDAPLEQMNRMLNVALRPFGGDLFVVEIESHWPGREGLLLYDDRAGLSITRSNAKLGVRHTSSTHLSEGLISSPSRIAKDPDGPSTVYYLEMMPYSDSLLSWVIGLRVNMDAVEVPYFKRNMVILSGITIAFIISLLLAHVGAIQIASPVRNLASHMKNYTNGRKAEIMHVQGPEEFRQAGKAFNLMVENLEEAKTARDEAELAMLQSEKLASIGQMAAGIGHEINNPLSNILSLTKLVERKLPQVDDELMRDVVAIKEETKRVSRIVNAILNFGRQSQPVWTHFDFGSWLQEVQDLVKTEADKRHITVQSDSDVDLVVEGDRSLLQQALVNLLLNALQASPEGSTIRLTSDVSEDGLRLTVKDQGSGIEPDVVAKIFDPFFTTKPEGEGSGLGLSISLGIVQHHGGTLELRNHPDGGVVATITLPADICVDGVS